ncbi:MAG: isoprenylcysteine carboxylmethyltransferase family protein [Nitrospirae bacterium]|nr:isoprenylcysteine carboxylmethyltransferase family protein [Nitrospirota bacterium]
MAGIARWIPAFSALAVLAFGVFNTVRLRRKIGKSPVVVLRTGSTPEKLRMLLLVVGCVLLVSSSIFPRLTELGRVIDPPASLQAAGALFMLGGLFVFVGAAYTLGDSWRIGVDPDLPTKLVTHGIYGSIRHPIYSALLCWVIGMFLLSLSGVLGLLAVVGIFGVRAQAIREERFLLGLFKEEYPPYMQRTGRFFPRLRRG